MQVRGLSRLEQARMTQDRGQEAAVVVGLVDEGPAQERSRKGLAGRQGRGQDSLDAVQGNRLATEIAAALVAGDGEVDGAGLTDADLVGEVADGALAELGDPVLADDGDGLGRDRGS